MVATASPNSMCFSMRRPQLVAESLNADALLLGPVQALDLTSDVEEAAQSFSSGDLASAAVHYARVAEKLRDRFPEHADRFEELRATALRKAGKPAESHDLLMKTRHS